MKEKRIGNGITVIFCEFFRYCLVGGVAFVLDFSALMLSHEFVFKSVLGGVYLATGVGFFVGLAVNYVLSLKFVFTQKKDAHSGRSIGAFAVFGIIGVIGLVLTEIGMWAGVELMHVHYLIVKVGVTVAVLIWNYLGRKVLIFNAKENV